MQVCYVRIEHKMEWHAGIIKDRKIVLKLFSAGKRCTKEMFKIMLKLYQCMNISVLYLIQTPAQSILQFNSICYPKKKYENHQLKIFCNGYLGCES